MFEEEQLIDNMIMVTRSVIFFMESVFMQVTSFDKTTVELLVNIELILIYSFKNLQA
ncbi:hypothetical protein JCM19297_1910 [Nonlabens ulvanivorans]|nr:hypothetical protein JCM19297_1910 [Nonlabens ulvanivorans]